MKGELTMYIDDNKVGDLVEEKEVLDSPRVRTFTAWQRVASPGLMIWCEEIDAEDARPRKLRFKDKDSATIEAATGTLTGYSLQCFLMGRITLHIQMDP